MAFRFLLFSSFVFFIQLCIAVDFYRLLLLLLLDDDDDDDEIQKLIELKLILERWTTDK